MSFGSPLGPSRHQPVQNTSPNGSTESGPDLLIPQPKWDLNELQTYALRNELKIETPPTIWFNPDDPYVMESSEKMFTVFSNVNKEMTAMVYHKIPLQDSKEDVLSMNPIWRKNLNLKEYTGTFKMEDNFCIQLFSVIDQYGEKIYPSSGGFTRHEVNGTTNLVLKCSTNRSGIVSADLVVDDRVIIQKKNSTNPREITIKKHANSFNCILALYKDKTLIQLYKFKTDAKDFKFVLPIDYCIAVTDYYESQHYMSEVIPLTDIGPGFVGFIHRCADKTIKFSLHDNDNLLVIPNPDEMNVVIQSELQQYDC